MSHPVSLEMPINKGIVWGVTLYMEVTPYVTPHKKILPQYCYTRNKEIRREVGRYVGFVPADLQSAASEYQDL